MSSIRKNKHQKFMEGLRGYAENLGLSWIIMDGRDPDIRGMSFECVIIDEYDSVTCIKV